MPRIPLTKGEHAIVDEKYHKTLTSMGAWHYWKGCGILSVTGERMPRVVARLAGIKPLSRILFRSDNKLDCRLENMLLTAEDRLWHLVKKAGLDDCWLWNGHTTADGYGRLSIYNRELSATRLVYESTYGPIEPGLDVCHTCDNPPCCNPRHLWIGTRAENNKDRADKGRSFRSRGELSENSKLTESNVIEILDSPETNQALADKYGVDHSLISRIRLGKAWKHVQRA